MTENELFALIRTNLERLLREFGAPPDTLVPRNYQTSQQGRTLPPCVYIARQNLKQHGSPRDYYRWTGDKKNVERINEQVVELTIQFQASVTYDPDKGLRPADLLGLASRIMGAPMWRDILRPHGVSMLRITENQQTFKVNDRDQYEAEPVLLAVFCYTDTLRSSVPAVEAHEIIIHRV